MIVVSLSLGSRGALARRWPKIKSDSRLRPRPYEHELPLKGAAHELLQDPTNSTARDDALKRRGNAVREALGMGQRRSPTQRSAPSKKKDERPVE